LVFRREQTPIAVNPLNAITKNELGSGTDAKFAVTMKLSIASPSSDPDTLKSDHRNQIDSFELTSNPVNVPEIRLLFSAAFPSRSPRVEFVTGLAKSSRLKLVHSPVVKLVALRLYANISLSASARFVSPRRHCSPVYSPQSR